MTTTIAILATLDTKGQEVDYLRQEVEALVRTQAERMVADLDLVPREEFDAMKELAVAARLQADSLTKRVEDLEGRLAKLESNATPTAPGE